MDDDIKNKPYSWSYATNCNTSDQQQDQTAAGASTKRQSTRRRSPLVVKLRGMFSCWSDRSSSYLKDDVYGPNNKPKNSTSKDVVSPHEQNQDKESEKQQALLHLIGGNEIEKLKMHIKKALYAVRDRDAKQKLPNNVPEAVTFICDYLVNVLSALKQANEAVMDSQGPHGPISKLFGNGKAFADFVAVIQKMHDIEVENGSCICPSDPASNRAGETKPPGNDRDADDETNGSDHTNGEGAAKQRSGAAKKQRRRKRRGGRKH